MTTLAQRLRVAHLQARAALDRRAVRALCRRHPGLEIDPTAAPAFATATFNVHEGARVRIGAGVVTERRRDAVRITVHPGGELDIGAGTWLRTEIQPVVIHVYDGARLLIGPNGFLNGCQVSAKIGVTFGRGVWVGPGSRVFDSDQHPLDDDTPEKMEPVTIGDHTWVAADVAVMRGTEIGAHCVVGARSLVSGKIEPHTLAYGVPARAKGRVGDRSGQ